MKHGIIPSLASLAVDISTLNHDPKNARLHDSRNHDAIVKSYAKHGQRKPLVVQRMSDKGVAMVVRAGNGQLAAAKELGWTHVAAVVIDENDRDAIAYAIRDNRTAELAEWDWQVIAEEVASFDMAAKEAGEGERFEDFGFSEAELVPIRQTDWFLEATGQLEDHTRNKPDKGDKDGVEKEEVTITGKDAVAFIEAMTLMRERFGEPGMNPGHVIGRLARHYLATVNHSQSPTN